jgi:hypothetical protein
MRVALLSILSALFTSLPPTMAEMLASMMSGAALALESPIWLNLETNFVDFTPSETGFQSTA